MLFGKVKSLLKLLIKDIEYQNVHSILKKVNINYIAVVLILIIAILYGIGKDLRQYERAGDSAIFEQLLYNIADGKGSVSNVFANTQHYIETYLGKTPINLIESDTLQGPVVDQRDMLKFHSYYILYPLSYLSKFIDSSLLLSIIQSLVFFGLLLVFYFFVSSKSSKFAGLIFALIIWLNPNWYGGIQGLFYPDKLFVIVGVLFCIALYERSLRYLIVLALSLMLLNERAALICGMVVILYLVSFSVYTNIKNKEYFDLKVLLIALSLLVYAYIAKNYILDNIYYGRFLPSNLNELVVRLQLPGFVDKIGINILNNLPIIILLFFSKRFILGALFVLSLNIIGNIGGAEKIGWTTHYHSYYFPIIAFAGAIGYINIINKINPLLTNVQKKAIQLIVIVFVCALFVVHQKYKINKLDITPLGSFEKYYHTLVDFAKIDDSGYTDKKALWKLIKPKSLVCTTEFGMAMLYQQNRVSFFPIDIDKADYIFIPSNYELEYLHINNQKVSFYDWLKSKHFNTENVIKIDKFGYSIFTKIDSQ